MRSPVRLPVLGVVWLALNPAPVVAQDDPANRSVYFGEQHMHTQNSFDAFTVAPKQTWEAAYRYGRGEPITLESSGVTIQRRTPYDFVAITDHSEYYGVLRQLTDPRPLRELRISDGRRREPNQDPDQPSFSADREVKQRATFFTSVRRVPDTPMHTRSRSQ